MSGFRDYNDLLSEDQASTEDGDNDEEIRDREEEDEEELEKLSHYAEIAAVERRVHEREEMMKLSPEVRYLVYQAFRHPYTVHKFNMCL